MENESLYNANNSYVGDTGQLGMGTAGNSKEYRRLAKIANNPVVAKDPYQETGNQEVGMNSTSRFNPYGQTLSSGNNMEGIVDPLDTGITTSQNLNPNEISQSKINPSLFTSNQNVTDIFAPPQPQNLEDSMGTAGIVS